METALSWIVGGDLIVGDDAETFFAGGIDKMLQGADIAIVQLEVPHSNRVPEFLDMGRCLSTLECLLGRFDAVTMAGNHIYDAKEIGVEDTLTWLNEHQLSYVGAGRNMEEAGKPLILVKDGVSIGILNYNCIGAAVQNAGLSKGGCNYIDIMTHYELNIPNPGQLPTDVFTFPKPESWRRMLSDIHALRKQCDILAVYFHKGMVHMPTKLADYEQFLSYTAIDAGADIIFGAHSHILHGIELYKGRTIYHGLGNFITWLPSLSPNYQVKKPSQSAEVFDQEDWRKKRVSRFGFTPDPAYPTYPFHPEAVNCIAAKIRIENKKIAQTGFIPMIVNTSGVPVVVARDSGGQQVMNYMEQITAGAGLNARFTWAGDEIIIEQA